MKIIIDNHDGMGQLDYSAYFDAEHLPKEPLNYSLSLQAGML